jgi:muramoyltetrapeptide carboxypeptidase
MSGDTWTFGIFAPAGAAHDPAAVERAAARLESLGHRVKIDPSVTERWQRFAGPDEARIAAIERVAADPEIEIAVALRGGYGMTRIIDRLDFVALKAAGKRWLGHSDFTAFHLAALARAGMVTFAGPMAAYDFGAEQPSAFTFEQLFGVLGHTSWSIECPLDGPARVTCSGTLWGGNLSIVAHLAGTPFLPDIAGGILFLEDVGEHPYRVERMLYQLAHAGILTRQRAVLLGAFTEYALYPHDEGYDLAGAIAHLRSRVQVPIFTGLPFGHVRDKVTLPVGGRCTLTTDEGMARLSLADYRA